MHAAKWLGLALAWVTGASLAQAPSWNDVIETSAPNGDAQVKSLALFGDGRMAAAAHARGGDAVFRFDAQAAETARWLPQATISPIINNILAVLPRPDGNAFAVMLETGGWNVVTIAPDGTELDSFPLGGELRAPARPVLGVTAITLVMRETGGPDQLRSFGFDGEVLGSHVVGSLQPQSTPPTATRLFAMPDGDVVLVESRFTAGADMLALRRLDAALQPIWYQDFTGIPGSSPQWHAVQSTADGGALASGTQLQDDGRRFAVIARVSAQGALSWHVKIAPSSGSATVEAYEYDEGVAFVGLASTDDPAVCLLQGTVDSQGMGLASSCSPLLAPAGVLLRERRALAQGAELLFETSEGNSDSLLRVRRDAAAAATSHQMTWSGPHGDVAATALSDAGVAAAVTVPGGNGNPFSPPNRLLRWSGAGAPVADSLTPAADYPHLIEDTLAAGDSATLVLRESTGLHVVHTDASGVPQWEASLPGAGNRNRVVAAGAGYRVHSADHPAHVRALESDGDLAWTHTIDAADSRIAVLDDGRTLIGYSPSVGSECRVRRIGTGGGNEADVALGVDGAVVDAISLGNAAILRCRPLAQPDVLVHVDAALGATVLAASACNGPTTQLVRIGGARWTVVSGGALGLDVCPYDGVVADDLVHLDVPDAANIVWREDHVHVDAARAELHLGATIVHDTGATAAHLRYRDAEGMLHLQPHRLLDSGEELLAMSAPDAVGRIGWVFSLQDGEQTRLEFGRPGLAPKWSHVEATQRPSEPAAAIMADDRLVVGLTDFHPWDEVVLRVGDARPGTIFDAGDFESP